MLREVVSCPLLKGTAILFFAPHLTHRTYRPLPGQRASSMEDLAKDTGETLLPVHFIKLWVFWCPRWSKLWGTSAALGRFFDFVLFWQKFGQRKTCYTWNNVLIVFVCSCSCLCVRLSTSGWIWVRISQKLVPKDLQLLNLWSQSQSRWTPKLSSSSSKQKCLKLNQFYIYWAKTSTNSQKCINKISHKGLEQF